MNNQRALHDRKGKPTMKVPGRQKYGAKRCIVTPDGTIFEVAQLKQYKIDDVQGITFDSKMEAEYYLHIRKHFGDFESVELQPSFILQDKPRIKYVADFQLNYDNGKKVVVDVKGTQTQAFRLKARLFVAKYPDLPLMLVTKKNRVWISKQFG